MFDRTDIAKPTINIKHHDEGPHAKIIVVLTNGSEIESTTLTHGTALAIRREFLEDRPVIFPAHNAFGGTSSIAVPARNIVWFTLTNVEA